MSKYVSLPIPSGIVADVLDAFAASDEAFAAIGRAIATDAEIFTSSAVLTYRAVSVTETITAKDLAALAKSRGVRGVSSVAMVCAHARTGQVLMMAGDLPDGIGPRDVQSFYSRKCPTGVAKGKNVSVTAAQHDAIMIVAADRADAINKLGAQYRKNVAAVTEKVKAETEAKAEAKADDEGEGEGDEGEGDVSVPTVAQLLAAAERAIGIALQMPTSSWTDADTATLNAIRDMLS